MADAVKLSHGLTLIGTGKQEVMALNVRMKNYIWVDTKSRRGIQETTRLLRGFHSETKQRKLQHWLVFTTMTSFVCGMVIYILVVDSEVSVAWKILGGSFVSTFVLGPLLIVLEITSRNYTFLSQLLF